MALLHPERLRGADPRLASFAKDLAARIDSVLNRDLLVSEGERPNERQDALYAQGRTAPGDIVTNAQAGESAHNPHSDGTFYALDLVAVDKRTGKALWNDTPSFDFIGAEANKYGGLRWGGDFKSITDKPHVEIADWKNARVTNPGLVAEEKKRGPSLPGWLYTVFPAAKLTGYVLGRLLA